MAPKGSAIDAGQKAILLSLIEADAARLRLLRLVQALDLADGWIGAGFVRSAVWDYLHGHAPSAPDGDIDVIWFDRRHEGSVSDRRIEAHLKMLEPHEDWSVKNQAWMHAANGDLPYTSVEDAMRRWPDTATAIAVRMTADGIEILAPHGLGDLFSISLEKPPRRQERQEK